MANAAIDQNSVATLTGALSSNGDSVVKVKADPSTHALQIDDNTTGSDFGPANALHDDNSRPTLIAVSSTTGTVGGISYVQGVTPVVVYVDSSGNLLVDSS